MVAADGGRGAAQRVRAVVDDVRVVVRRRRDL
jgi:hypothetical protein